MQPYHIPWKAPIENDTENMYKEEDSADDVVEGISNVA